MATPYRIVLGADDIGNFHVGSYNAAAAAKVSEVLQLNLESWDIIFSGLRHNHIVHCILTIYALGATPEQIQAVYDREASYQRKRPPIDETLVKNLSDRDVFKAHLGQQPHYSDYLLYFQREIEAKGVKATLEEHLFANDDHANRLFALIYNGIFHPLLHLGYAFEFNQPALVAEGLAMASVHDPDYETMGPVFIEAERQAGGAGQHRKTTLRQLLEEVREDRTLHSSPNGDNKIDRSKNVANHATDRVVEYAARYSLTQEELSESLHEMVDTCALLIANKPPAIKDGQQHKIDFFLLHSVNTLAMMPSLIDHEWISKENATRLLEWAGRCHLLNYVSQVFPPLSSAEIEKYSTSRTWEELFTYSILHPSDDGHLSKCVRSLAFGEKLSSQGHGSYGGQLKPALWLPFANLVTDTVKWNAKTSPERWLLSFDDVEIKT